VRAPAAHSCEHGRQALHSIKCEELIDYTDGRERSPKDDVNDRAIDFPLYVLLLPFRSAVSAVERVRR